MQNRELLAILIMGLMIIALGLAWKDEAKTVAMPRITKEEAAVRHQQDRDDAAAMSLFGVKP